MVPMIFSSSATLHVFLCYILWDTTYPHRLFRLDSRTYKHWFSSITISFCRNELSKNYSFPPDPRDHDWGNRPNKIKFHKHQRWKSFSEETIFTFSPIPSVVSHTCFWCSTDFYWLIWAYIIIHPCVLVQLSLLLKHSKINKSKNGLTWDHKV